MSYRAVKNERVSSYTKNQCHPERRDTQAWTSMHHSLFITFDRPNGSILRLISLTKLCLFFFIRSFIAQVYAVIFDSVPWRLSPGNPPVEVILRNVVRILLVLQKFHVSSTWLFSWMFSPVSVCRWRLLESHYLTEQCIVVYWRWNNVWSFKSVSIAILWMRASSVFFRFQIRSQCRSQTSNQYQTMRAMPLYLILD